MTRTQSLAIRRAVLAAAVADAGEARGEALARALDAGLDAGGSLVGVMGRGWWYRLPEPADGGPVKRSTESLVLAVAEWGRCQHAHPHHPTDACYGW